MEWLCGLVLVEFVEKGEKFVGDCFIDCFLIY